MIYAVRVNLRAGIVIAVMFRLKCNGIATILLPEATICRVNYFP